LLTYLHLQISRILTRNGVRGDVHDVVAEGLALLRVCIWNFNQDMDVSFSTYMWTQVMPRLKVNMMAEFTVLGVPARQQMLSYKYFLRYSRLLLVKKRITQLVYVLVGTAYNSKA
jgi:hypothetical protein